MTAVDMQAARPTLTTAPVPRRQTAEQLKNQRLSRPLALGVLSCDGLSSAAYGTEEILRALADAIGGR